VIDAPGIDHFTPCISFWISGAIRNSSTPEPISA
jgi:hypothetical protein